MKKRILSLVLAVVMVLCLVPAISMVSFAAEENYSILPDDTNKAHFLSLVEAYKDDVAIPAAAVINEKLSGYLELNKEMTIEEQAEIVAKAIRIYAPTDALHEENIQIITEYITSNPIPEGTAQRAYAKALATKLVFANGTDDADGYRLYAARNTANYYAWAAVSASGVTTTVDENLPLAWATAIYMAGVRVYGVEDTQDAQTAHVAAAIKEIITKGDEDATNDIKTVDRQHGDNIFTPLAEAVHFVTLITASGNGNTDGVGGNNTGPWTHVSSGMEQVVKQMNYGTHKVADFYLNFSDVATTGEAAEFKAILDYYFAPGAGNYGYYEDLWYDDGHLVYFVDTANLNNPHATSTNQSETDQTAVAPSHFARFIKTASASSKGNQLGSAMLRPHVKVVGGYEIGRYFTIGTNLTALTLTTEVNQAGFLRVYGDNTSGAWNATTTGGFNRETAIYLGYSYSYEQTYLTLNQHTNNANNSTERNDYNYFNDNGITYEADENGYYGGYTMQFAMRLDKEFWWSNAYYTNFKNATASNTYAANLYASNVGFRLLGITTDGGNTYDVSGALIHLGSKWDATLNGGEGGYVMSYETVNSGFNAEGGLNTFNQSKYAGALGDYMSITVSAGYIVPERQIAMTTRLNVNGTESYQEAGSAYGYQYGDTSNETTFYPNMNNVKRSLHYASTDAQVHRGIMMQDKLMSNFRAYDCMLTDEQIVSNRVADLFYEKGVDLTVFNALSDAKKDAVIDAFADADFDTATKAGIETQIEEISNTPVYDDEYKNYAHLWYDDGHLVAFIDFMNIVAGERKATDAFANLTSQYLRDPYRMLNANSSHNDLTSTGVYHSFIRIVGGQKAGEWYPIFSRYGNQNNGITNYDFPLVKGGFLEFAEDLPTGYGTGVHTGILINKSYTDETAVQKLKLWSGITADSYFHPNADASNAFTVDSAIFYDDAMTIGNSAVHLYSRTSKSQNPLILENGNSTNRYENMGVISNYVYNKNNGTLSFGLGYQSRFGGNSATSLGGSFQIATVVDFENSYSFLAKYKAILNQADGGLVQEKSASWPKSIDSSHTEDPFYGMYVGMDDLQICTGHATYHYYSRIYDVEITAEQMMQNHFADLMYYNRIDTAKYDALSDSDKATLWAWATDIQLSDADVKATIEAKIDAMAEDNTSIINFKGFQARVSKNVGVRSVFYLDQSAIANAGVTVKAYGAIAGTAVEGADFDNFTISYDATKGVTVSANAKMTASTDDDFKLIADVEKEFILGSAENLNNYTMFAYTVDFINGSIDRNGVITGTSMIDTLKDTEMFFRAFAVVEYKGATYIHYVDGASANYDNTSVSLTEISEHYAKLDTQFANNACIKAVVGENFGKEEQ